MNRLNGRVRLDGSHRDGRDAGGEIPTRAAAAPRGAREASTITRLVHQVILGEEIAEHRIARSGGAKSTSRLRRPGSHQVVAGIVRRYGINPRHVARSLNTLP